jgi:hypothetical protein
MVDWLWEWLFEAGSPTTVHRRLLFEAEEELD